MRRRSWLPPVAALVVGILIASGLTVFTLNQGAAGCSPGPVVAQVNDTLTPWLVVNSPYSSPYGEFSNGTLPVENGTKLLTFGAYGGMVAGYFERTNWTIRLGTGTLANGSSCSGVFFVSPTDLWSSDIFASLAGNNTSTSYLLNDSQEPTFVNISWAGGPVYYYNGFYQTTSQLSTCGDAAAVKTTVSNHIRVGVSFPYHGTAEIVNTTLAINTSYRYVFPANTGTWLIDNLSAPGGPGGGWAFSYLGSCT